MRSLFIIVCGNLELLLILGVWRRHGSIVVNLGGVASA